jgi:outer membrane protein OmpA-like peptidoglycan-associated protein
VNALAPARSAFVERVRAELGDRPGVAFAGDRVVLETDPLFAGRHTMRLTREGEARLGAVARALAATVGQVPADAAWVLRVEDYTDAAPPRAESAFRSNRALSAGRAAAAAEYLAGHGVTEDRLSAVAMGAARPLEAGATAGGGRHERRLEIGLAPAEAAAEGGGQPAAPAG